MSAPRFYELKVKDVRTETTDCVSVALEVPDELWETFQFAPGQYLTFHKHIEGAEIRRSYSICVSPKEKELRVAIKKVEGGKFSGFANETLKKGDVLDVMTPQGKFSPKPSDKTHRNYLFIAAGSGITPVISIMKTVLEDEPESNVTLVYGNRNRNTIIFREAIEALKNKHMQRFSVFHILSREQMDVDLFNGRITADKCAEFCKLHLIDIANTDEAFICGPEEMIFSLREKLAELGMSESNIHIELFTSPDQPNIKHEKWVKEHKRDSSKLSRVSITLDGNTFEMDLAYSGDSILDAALKHGADLPYACKGGVCCTCRAKVKEGAVDMEVNYALEKDEVTKGFVLTCQSHPKTERVVIDFDER